MPGYKACLCTNYMVPELECKEEVCFLAHGVHDRRRLPPGVPRSVAGIGFLYSDSHCHLDHVLLSRRYGQFWYYKHQTCKRKDCYIDGAGGSNGCMFVHYEAERQARPLERADVEALAAEFEALPGTFAGVIHSCCEVEDIDRALQLVAWGRELLGGKIYVSFGVHPTHFEDFTPEVEAKLKAAMEACGAQAVAWGECGLDYYRRSQDDEEDADVKVRMQEAFRKQAHIAVRKGLPLVVHSRDAEKDTMNILRRVVPSTHPIHLHSYMGSVETMRDFLDSFPNSCVGIAGAVTYEGSQYPGGLYDIARALPLDRLLLETDGPFMAPNPYRGEESHPGHIPWIADGVARVKGVAAAEVLARTHANFKRLYDL